MTELQTLKDIELWNSNKEILKQEAIKWIKQDIKDYRYADMTLPIALQGIKIHNFIVEQRKKWMERFNITEEDLI